MYAPAAPAAGNHSQQQRNCTDPPGGTQHSCWNIISTASPLNPPNSSSLPTQHQPKHRPTCCTAHTAAARSFLKVGGHYQSLNQVQLSTGSVTSRFMRHTTSGKAQNTNNFLSIPSTPKLAQDRVTPPSQPLQGNQHTYQLPHP